MELKMATEQKTVWQALAASRWPGHGIEGSGSWACVDSSQRTVRLFEYQQPAQHYRLEAKWRRAVCHLEEVVKAVVWERDKWDEN
jgi:hypothetical protein